MLRRITLQGQSRVFKSFRSEKYMEGGLLNAPLEVHIWTDSSNHILSFVTLYYFTDSKKILGGDLAFPHYLRMGRKNSKSWVPAISVLFHAEPFHEDNLSIELLRLPLLVKAEIVINNERYLFVPSSCNDELMFYENGQVMSGFLNPSLINTQYGKLLAQRISFYEDGGISSIGLVENTTLELRGGEEFEFMGGYDDYSKHQYTINFTREGRIMSGILSDGTFIEF